MKSHLSKKSKFLLQWLKVVVFTRASEKLALANSAVSRGSKKT